MTNPSSQDYKSKGGLLECSLLQRTLVENLPLMAAHIFHAVWVVKTQVLHRHASSAIILITVTDQMG